MCSYLPNLWLQLLTSQRSSGVSPLTANLCGVSQLNVAHACVRVALAGDNGVILALAGEPMGRDDVFR